MPYPGVDIKVRPPVTGFAPTRADIALFVGLVGRRPEPLPDEINRFLKQSDFAGTGPFARTPEMAEALLDIPVPVESWDMFDAIFAWDERPVAPDSQEQIPCRLGLAVRSFFEEGGAKAYIVRTGDPLSLISDNDDQEAAREEYRKLISWANIAPPDDADQRVPLISGFDNKGSPPSVHDPATWTGSSHILGVEDAALIVLPDLPDLIAGPPRIIPVVFEPDDVDEQFRDCAPLIPGVGLQERQGRRNYSAPRLDLRAYGDWARTIRQILTMMDGSGGAAHRRDVMLVASLPLPDLDDPDIPQNSQNWPLAILSKSLDAFGNMPLLDQSLAGSARLQLCYPWVTTSASMSQPENAEGSEGLVAGAIARTSLTRGAFASIAGPMVGQIQTTVPVLATSDIKKGAPGTTYDWLGACLNLIGRKHGQYQCLSDATSSPIAAWQAGPVSRTMAILLRNAREIGQSHFFGVSGPESWAALEREMENLLFSLWQAGALSGANPAAAYDVQCNRKSMSQYDIDNGRMIARVSFTPAQMIERINVSLTLGNGGQL